MTFHLVMYRSFHRFNVSSLFPSTWEEQMYLFKDPKYRHNKHLMP